MNPLIKAKKIGDLIGIENLYFKLESQNKSGTFKSRAADVLVKEAIKHQSPGITIGTCGNFGMAIIKSSPASLNCHIFVPKHYNYSQLTKEATKSRNVKIYPIEGKYEDAVENSIKFSKETGCYNANPQNKSAKLSITAYSKISKEIVKQPKTTPQYLWISVGNGTGIAGLYYFFKNKSKKPKLCAVSSLNNNAIVKSIFYGYPVELDPNILRETLVNEPLLNWRSYQINEAIEAINQTEGLAVEVTDGEMLNAQKMIKTYENIDNIPAAAAAFAGLLKNLKIINRLKKHVIVLTA